ncbi:MAG TPA: hypothetical protein VMB05_15725 [Solirubrobacteraceae bacterium]|nr:hypothetical protein [Solirubrobacteraceae bacterium]
MARSLRVERQLTVDELAARLALPRSTIYYWVRDLPLREDRHSEAMSSEGSAELRASQETPSGPAERGEAVSRERSEAAYEEGLQSFDELAAQPTFRDFVCVYLLAGEQRDRTRVALTNSDPAVMRLASRWLRRLTDRALSLSLQYGPGQSLAELRRFWGEAVGAEPRAIGTRARGRARSAQGGGGDSRGGEGGGAKHESDTQEGSTGHGLLTVTVEDSLLRARLQGWMQRTREGWR